METPVITWSASCREQELLVGLPAGTVLNRLEAAIDPVPAWGEAWGLWSARRPFFGTVGNKAFQVRKYFGGRRLDAPQLLGEVAPAPGGTLIRYRVKAPTFTLAFLLAFPPLFTSLFVAAARLGGGGLPLLLGVVLPLVPVLLMYKLLRAEAAALAGLLPRLFRDHPPHALPATRVG